MNLLVPLIYYPFKTLLVDDNSDILTSYSAILSDKHTILSTQQPLEALDILQNSTFKHLIFNDITEKQEINLTANSNEFSTVQFTFDNIIKIANDKNKYQEYGILITDYDMPEMNGIELCQQLKSTAVMKILLTGKYELNNAVNALNNKVIDCYIKKGEINTIDDLKFYTTELTNKYFTNITEVAINAIGTNKLQFLFDPVFAELINAKIIDLNINEFYLISSNGNFLLVNQNKKYVLVVYTDKELTTFCDEYKHEPKIKNFLKSIDDKRYIPFFGVGVSPDDIAFSNWENCLYPANKHQNYYWHLITL